MGSVGSYIECPRCKEEAYNDFYYKSGEEFINCDSCGYNYSATFKRDNTGKFITKDGLDDYHFDNLIMEENEISNPYGAYKIQMVGDIGRIGGTLITQEDYDNLVQEMALLQNSEKSVQSFVVSRFVDGKIIKEEII